MCGGVCYPSEEFRCSPQAAAASPLLTSPRTAELSGLCAPLWEATLGGRGWSAWLLLFVEKLLKWVRQKGRLLLLQPWGSAVLSGAFLAYCLVLHLRSGRGGGSPRETLRRRLEPQGLFQGAGGSPSRRAPRGAGERSPRRATELCGGPGARGARRRICPAERRWLHQLYTHSSHLLALDLVLGWKCLFLPSCSKMDEDRRQHKTTRALGEIPRLRAK